MTNHIRLRNGNIQVATERWENSSTGEVIILSGACHVATKQYWHTIRDRLNGASAQGMALHLEGIRRVDLDTTTGLTDSDIEAIKATRGLGVVQKKMALILGLDHQREFLESVYAKHGTIDVSELEVARSMTPEQVEKLKNFDLPFGDMEPQKRVSKLFRRALWFAFKHVLTSEYFRSRAENGSSFTSREFLITERNKVAIDAALAATEKEVILFWGAAHLKGMGELLDQAGFKRVTTIWDTVAPKQHKPWTIPLTYADLDG